MVAAVPALWNKAMRPTDDRPSGMARPTYDESPAGKRPPWLKVRLNAGKRFSNLKALVAQEQLHTVCQSAACPNIGECWSRGAVTFMIGGNICTRSCGFCDVLTGKPKPVDMAEPERLARSLARLELRYAVVTSVDRDDLDDGGAGFWAETIRQVKTHCPKMMLEVLVPDFKGDHDDVRTVVGAGPDVYAHNMETVERLHLVVRPQAKYARSLSVLAAAKQAGATTKSGIMLGLGEEDHEAVTVLEDLRRADVDIISIGQYMRPGPRHLPVQRWVHPDVFKELEQEARRLGFTGVKSGPLVRSSYRADEQAGFAFDGDE